jgi:lipoprotein-releasing system permease protein
MALTISLALMTGFEQDIQGRILTGNAHLTIVPFRHDDVFEDPAQFVKSVEAVPGVAAASALVEGSGILTNAERSLARWSMISGVDPDMQQRVVPLDRQMVEGLASSIKSVPDGDRPPILLGKDLAGALAVSPGDLVQLFVAAGPLTPFGSLPRPTWLRVAGVFDAGFFEYNAVRAYIPLETARKLYRVASANQVELRVTSLQQIDTIESDVRAKIGKRYLVGNLVRENKSLLSALRWEKLLMFIVISLIVLVAALNIVSTLILMVMEKVRDIGTLVALGATSRAILMLFVLQGLVIGVVGTLMGLFGGIAASVVCDRYRLIALDPDVYFVPFVPFRVRPVDSAAIALLSIAISLAATIYPAWRASRLNPVEALRHG